MTLFLGSCQQLFITAMPVFLPFWHCLSTAQCQGLKGSDLPPYDKEQFFLTGLLRKSHSERDTMGGGGGAIICANMP